jgi:hypothetical protein
MKTSVRTSSSLSYMTSILLVLQVSPVIPAARAIPSKRERTSHDSRMQMPTPTSATARASSCRFRSRSRTSRRSARRRSARSARSTRPLQSSAPRFSAPRAARSGSCGASARKTRIASLSARRPRTPTPLLARVCSASQATGTREARAATGGRGVATRACPRRTGPGARRAQARGGARSARGRRRRTASTTARAWPSRKCRCKVSSSIAPRAQCCQAACRQCHSCLVTSIHCA